MTWSILLKQSGSRTSAQTHWLKFSEGGFQAWALCKGVGVVVGGWGEVGICLCFSNIGVI